MVKNETRKLPVYFQKSKEGAVFSFLLLGFLIVLFSANTKVVFSRELDGWSGEKQSEKNVTESKVKNSLDFSEVLELTLIGVKDIFIEKQIVYSPLPLTLSGGIKPRPTAVFSENFARGDEKNSQDVLGAKVEKLPTKYFYRENKSGLKVYSFEDGQHNLNADQTVGSKDVDELTEKVSADNRGEVWGARIAGIESEIKSCIKDSGVILSAIVVSLLVVLWFLVFFIRKILS